MLTVGAARSWAIGEFKRSGVECPEISADLLLGFVLGWDRVRILSRFEHPVEGEDWGRLRNLVSRRVSGEPLQHLTGEQEFYGLRFLVTPEVLIPRPETELLVEEGLSLIRALPSQEVRFLDVGTGSGCVAVAIAHEVPAARGWATDVSAGALPLARENAVRHGVAARIQFIRADLLECFPLLPRLEFILSNPPYVALDDYDSLPPVVKDHEPRRALFGGAGGLEVYRRLIPASSARLTPGGCLLLELGAGQESQVGRLAEGHGLSILKVLKDLQGISRCLVARKTSGSDHG